MTHRRDFLKHSGAAVSAALLKQQATPKTLRVGFVGVGVKGSAHVGNLLRMEGVELTAVCDIREIQCRETVEQAKRLGHRPPKIYARGERDFERLCAEEELDLVYTATPWHWHVPVCLAAMRNGKHAATEVPAAYTLDECWALVETSEKMRRHCSMMENVNYQRDELTILNLVRRGLLGELIHGEGGYLHDTRQLKMNDFGDGLWLGDHHATRNGNLYPTHGLGPMAWYMNLNRGDRLDYLVSMSTKPLGLNLFAAAKLPAGHPKRERKYKNGDVNTVLMRTVNGLTINLTHDTDLPRPYERINLVQGTKGVIKGHPQFQLSLEAADGKHKFEPGANHRPAYEHPIWQPMVEAHAKQAGIQKDYGAILPGAVWDYRPEAEMRNGDFIEDYRLVQALRRCLAPDFNVYDAATWSAVAWLSEQSVAQRSRSIDFPDFTRGGWKSSAPIEL
jgi:predicted dehydrogenase